MPAIFMRFGRTCIVGKPSFVEPSGQSIYTFLPAVLFASIDKQSLQVIQLPNQALVSSTIVAYHIIGIYYVMKGYSY